MRVYKIARVVKDYYLSSAGTLPPSVRRRYRLRETVRPYNTLGPLFAYRDLADAVLAFQHCDCPKDLVILKCEAAPYYHALDQILAPWATDRHSQYADFWAGRLKGTMPLSSDTVLCAAITPLEVVTV